MRIGIYVADEVIRQIKQLDPGVNVSRICREAIGSYCASVERIPARVGGDGMDEQVGRLSQERLPQPDWVGHALDDAGDWVNAIEPDDWDEFFNLHDGGKSRGDDVTWLHSAFYRRECKGFFDRFGDHMEWFQREYKINRNSDARATAEAEYTRAWFGYVNEVRRRQQQHIADRYKIMTTDLEKARAARPEPELPQQLMY